MYSIFTRGTAQNIMADYSAIAVLFVSLSIFVFFKYCLGHPHDDNGGGLDAFRYDNATRTVLQHVVYDEFSGSASAQMQFVWRRILCTSSTTRTASFIYGNGHSYNVLTVISVRRFQKIYWKQYTFKKYLSCKL